MLSSINGSQSTVGHQCIRNEGIKPKAAPRMVNKWVQKQSTNVEMGGLKPITETNELVNVTNERRKEHERDDVGPDN